MKILAIIKRDKPMKHYEVHYSDKVEFITLNGCYLGESKIIETVDV